MSFTVGPGRHVFVSHTTDMAHYPRPTSFVQGVFAAANRAGLVPVNMTYFEAREGKTVDYCRQRVREAELYVAVVGFRNGSVVPGTTMSYTETEFREAGAAGRERLVFLLDEDAPIPTSFVDENRHDIEAFRRRLRSESGVVVATFSSVEQLELKVHHAFSLYLHRAPAPRRNGRSAEEHPDSVDEYSYMDRVARIGSFSTQRVADFRTKMRLDVVGEVPEQLDAREFLQYANLLRDGHLTNAGALLFGEDPTAAIPHAVVQCARFNGESRTSPLEPRDLRGTVPELIERARDFVGNVCLLGEVPSTDGAYTEPVYDIPMIAVREIIANALVHRDYEQTDSCVHIRVFSDRVEVVNPGTWGYPEAIPQGRYSLHELMREPSRRNFRLASVLRWSALVEGEGTGVLRAVDDSKRLRAPEPTVALAEGRVKVTINRLTHKQPRRRRAPYLLAGAAVATVLIVAASFLLIPLLRSGACDGLFSAMTMTDTGECVGVVDTNDVLDPQLHRVVGQIRTENQNVAVTTDRYARIVLLTPLSVSQVSASAMGLDQIRYSLEGVYTALYRVNRTIDFGDPSVMKVQLLLANYGSRQEYSDRLLADILGQSEASHPVVAVVGLGSSFTGTEAMAQALANRGIPMVSAVASADSLNVQRFTGLRSVSPSNTDYVLALKQLLDRHPDLLRSGTIVADQNDDLYVQSLRAAYASTLGSYLKFPAMSFAGGTIGSPATPGVFAPVVTNLCTAVFAGLDVVFYAGRVADFDAFAEALSTRTCRNKPLAVLVGVTGFQVAQPLMNFLKDGNVAVVYASATDPQWVTDASLRPAGFTRFLEIAEREIGPVSLTDGFAVMYHDAVVCAASALRLAAHATGTPGPADVEIQFGNLNLSHTIPAASGTLAFNSRADGRARGKAVVVRYVGRFDMPTDLETYFT